MHFPHSLGLLYSAFTYYAGFKVNSGEYKLMGLAPYGEPLYRNKILDNLIDLKDDGSFRLNMDYFDFETGSKMTSLKFNQLFGRDPRVPESEISRFDMDIAASIQEVAEEVVLRIAQDIHRLTGHKNLCLAGGVALNCVANGRLLREGPFDKIWIQPAAGDAGGAMGAALYAHNMIFKNERVLEADGKDCLSGSYLGTEYSSESIESSLNKIGANFIKMEKSEKPKIVAQLLAKESVVGWFNGAMEFGPRALGARSILGDPRSPEMQSIMNLKIKYRENGSS
jgi:carbamoyltransferase